jgi:hypothetical protein
VKDGRLECTKEAAESALLPAAIDAGLSRASAKRSFDNGWAKGSGEPVKPKERPALREVQPSAATVATLPDVRAAVDLLLGVLSDARIRNKVSSIIFDALEVFEVSKSGKPGDAA